MDKKSVMYAAGALIIILVVALVVKPIVTGQPLNTGLPVATTPLPAIPPTPPARTLTPTPQASSPLPLPTAIPTWDKTVAKIGFVDPSTYGISLNLTLPNGTRIDSVGRTTGRVPFATIPGQYSATTQVLHIPFPYWEIWYTVVPAGKMGGKDQSLSSSTVQGAEGVTHTFLQGSFSVITPTFTLDVMDAADPNRIVRTITPPGGLDSTLWTNSNPRPWKEKFFEGKKDYFFVIKAHDLSSYSVEIMVPAEYIGKY
ncbi:MAG: hypothetical protein WC294_02705 [Methanoregula sp.]